jgi:SAM-dependent methyltransferase
MVGMTTALAVYGAALRRAAAGQPPAVDMLDGSGMSLGVIDPTAWVGGLIPGDRAVLDRCADGTLDVGCGPGRLIAALHLAGRTALGVDISPQAVRLARRRGAPAMCRDVFAPMPGEGTWRTVLLTDGSIGIGGDPPTLLGRCRRLLAAGGRVLVEVRGHGEPSWHGHAVLRDVFRQSAPFPWATVSADGIAAVAAQASLRVTRIWTEHGRWFAELTAS